MVTTEAGMDREAACILQKQLLSSVFMLLPLSKVTDVRRHSQNAFGFSQVIDLGMMIG